VAPLASPMPLTGQPITARVIGLKTKCCVDVLWHAT
jgi:hypothetical protein